MEWFVCDASCWSASLLLLVGILDAARVTGGGLARCHQWTVMNQEHHVCIAMSVERRRWGCARRLHAQAHLQSPTFNNYTNSISDARGCSNDAPKVGHAGAQQRFPLRSSAFNRPWLESGVMTPLSKDTAGAAGHLSVTWAARSNSLYLHRGGLPTLEPYQRSSQDRRDQMILVALCLAPCLRWTPNTSHRPALSLSYSLAPEKGSYFMLFFDLFCIHQNSLSKN